MKHLTKPHTLSEIGIPTHTLVKRSKLIGEKLMERDYFLDAQQALELGLVDKVLTTREEQDEIMRPVNGGAKKDGGESGGGDKGGGDGDGGQGSASPAVNPSPS